MADDKVTQLKLPLPELESIKRDWHFWAIFLSLAISTLVSALDLTAISTALPVITHELHGSQFVWVGSAYALASTAFLPMSGGLAQVFGRKPVIVAALFIFAVGSAMCGAAPSMNFLIAARTIQGVGGGGILSLTQIIVSDLVPLDERGWFNGLLGISWSLAGATGPLIGGALAQRGAWRWLFYLNIFIVGLASIFIFVFLHLKTPTGTVREKLERMDWIGNVIVVAATSLLVIALTWGGVQYSWSSARVLVPLILGLIGLVFFFLYELKFPKEPIVPFHILSNLTTVSGYLQTFIMSIVMLAVTYYLPVYYQACQGASPIATGVDAFGISLTLAPFGIVAGASVARYKRYRPQIWLAWILLIIGTGLFTTLKADTSRGKSIGLQTIVGVGLGLIITTLIFPVLAPLPVSANAHAMAFFVFSRSFGQVFGVTIGATVLQNELSKRLPTDFVSAFPEGAEIAYASISVIGTLSPSVRDAVREAFADSLRVVWQVLIGIAGVGFLLSMLMKHLELHKNIDQEWNLAEKEKSGSSEGGVV